MKCHYKVDVTWPFLVHACLSSPSLPYMRPFPSFLSFSLKACLSHWVPLSLLLPSPWPGALLPARWSAPSSRRAGSVPPTRIPSHEAAGSAPAEGAGRGRGAAARMGGAGGAGCRCYIYACAAQLRGQSGRRRQDGAASDAGDRERGRTRAARAHQWGGGGSGILGAGDGSESELPVPASPQWVSESKMDPALAQPLAPTHLLSQRLGGGAGGGFIFPSRVPPPTLARTSLSRRRRECTSHFRAGKHCCGNFLLGSVGSWRSLRPPQLPGAGAF